MVKLVLKCQVLDADIFHEHMAYGPGVCVQLPSRPPGAPGCDLWDFDLTPSRVGPPARMFLNAVLSRMTSPHVPW